ncbi:hypothetical protein HanRHA438_Chr05g0215971 [Helianthus annuus]|uniref:Secreted protein n=1 Tax=Helianthus annuus TaxID=4232 RepID=A0A251UN17_HELAN|nr:hypothetical protein HanXRQr2_Chr05g0206321 [Helianthus annuus]KAJ0569699.1 hypothetical protein HanHA300_Chr05g0169351 [Helianthus annuus]KAJ0584016.1 hypothetical protein HanHA89_Chr05g0183471 [Helianthus annuus]KAJ0918279.1 hypothetical protein HanRHA438_Chr05g0215971 [Helianthus annuus]KAJ0922072.1 hypothetical protein HanPSC8_Chr05g0199241 [Helianthus annuus]
MHPVCCVILVVQYFFRSCVSFRLLRVPRLSLFTKLDLVLMRDGSGEKRSPATGYTTWRLSGYIDEVGVSPKNAILMKIIRRINQKAIFIP